MAEPENPSDLALRARKVKDSALIMPLIGLLFLTPPIANLFAVDERLFGVPVLVIYIFAVWAMLILGALILSRRLRQSEEDTRRLRAREVPYHPDGMGP
ncbi:hypothetical protein KHP62_06500 [Rhodobacteraceae bacterium NNCM2]|nr:hypothetical protein [Coraliihabitans acroporae]